jgi:hypothetical protein
MALKVSGRRCGRQPVQGRSHRDRSTGRADQVTAADLILSWARAQKQNAHANLIALH